MNPAPSSSTAPAPAQVLRRFRQLFSAVRGQFAQIEIGATKRL